MTQLFYILPMVILLREKGRFAIARGVVAGAVITALLNGGCYVMVFTGNFRIAG